MYRSIHEKLLTLPDNTEVFPAHGAGSLPAAPLTARTRREPLESAMEALRCPARQD